MNNKDLVLFGKITFPASIMAKIDPLGEINLNSSIPSLGTLRKIQDKCREDYQLRSEIREIVEECKDNLDKSEKGLIDIFFSAMDKNESMFKKKKEVDEEGNLKPLDVSYEELEDLKDQMYWEDPGYNNGYTEQTKYNHKNYRVNPKGNEIVQNSRPLGTITKEIYEDFGEKLKINFLVSFFEILFFRKKQNLWIPRFI